MTMSNAMRREERVRKLCAKLHTTKMFICDPMMTRMLGIPSIDPMLIEKLLVKRGEMAEDGESIRDALTNHYGKETAELAESLI